MEPDCRRSPTSDPPTMDTTNRTPEDSARSGVAHRVIQVRETVQTDGPESPISDISRTTTPRPVILAATVQTHGLTVADAESLSGDRSRDHSREPDTTRQRRPSRQTIGDADASDDVISLPKVHRKPPQSFSDPTASPGMRMSKSRLNAAAAVNVEKSPHRKRSKSESRRRRDRKMLAAGELEVRQANETLMRYLRQCTEINDASLSGELEIDKSYDDRKVHRKTKSQRERRGFHPGGSAAGGSSVAARSRMQLHSGLTNILNTLVDDIAPNSGEIYNPFTPVISPTEGPHLGINKMFVQSASSYREVDDNNSFKDDVENGDEERGPHAQRIIDLSCTLQRSWILLSNLVHGLLGGLALAHLLLVLTTNPYDWLDGAVQNGSVLAHAYASCFYCLAVVCLVSIFDRMDFCRLHSAASESVSFRWIIILMIYLATNILCLSTEATIEHQTEFMDTNATEWLGKIENNRILGVWSSLSIVRSVCAIIGWILVGMYPQSDMLFDHLLEMEKHQLDHN